jgi:hypothetical protein
MSDTAHTYDELLDLTQRQAHQIERLRAEVDRLKQELEETCRAGKRPAAPFSKGPPKADPKRLGRKPGHPPSLANFDNAREGVNDMAGAGGPRRPSKGGSS